MQTAPIIQVFWDSGIETLEMMILYWLLLLIQVHFCLSYIWLNELNVWIPGQLSGKRRLVSSCQESERKTATCHCDSRKSSSTRTSGRRGSSPSWRTRSSRRGCWSPCRPWRSSRWGPSCWAARVEYPGAGLGLGWWACWAQVWRPVLALEDCSTAGLSSRRCWPLYPSWR